MRVAVNFTTHCDIDAVVADKVTAAEDVASSNGRLQWDAAVCARHDALWALGLKQQLLIARYCRYELADSQRHESSQCTVAQGREMESTTMVAQMPA